MNYKELVEQLVSNGRLKSPQIIQAFKKVDRVNFMLSQYKDQVGIDTPFPIGSGQTISQPSTVAFMIEKLQPQKGQKILDIGAGSGWTSALLAEIVGPKGKIYGIEIVPEVFEFGKENINRTGYKNIEFLNTDASGGLSQKAPFDRILGGASAPEIPEPLKRQLKITGRIVMPVQDAVVMLEKTGKNKFKKEIYPFFAFVPMRGEYGQK